MKPDNNQPPITPNTTNQPSTPPANSGSGSSWKNRLSSLNWPKRLLLLVGALLSILILSSAIYQIFYQEPTQAPQVSIPAQASVAITSDGLSPATITIKEGTQLTWTNNDSRSHQPAADPHPLNNSIAGFEGNTTLLSADSLSFTFEQAGSYSYHDHLNPLDSKWQGTVIVE